MVTEILSACRSPGVPLLDAFVRWPWQELQHLINSHRLVVVDGDRLVTWYEFPS